MSLQLVSFNASLKQAQIADFSQQLHFAVCVNQLVHIKTCSAAKVSVNGFTMTLVAKQKNNPKVIEMGSAGRAFLVTASKRSVRHKP